MIELLNLTPSDMILIGYDSNTNIVNIDSAWALYSDTEYTLSSPFRVTAGDDWVTFPNDALSKIETQLNDNISLYDGSLIDSNAINDSYFLGVRFKGKASAMFTTIKVGIDIGGTQGIFIQDSRLFSLNAGEEEALSVGLTYFTGATFLANKGNLVVKSINGNIDLYNINFFFVKLHKAI